MPSITNIKDFAKKKTYSVSAAVLDFSDFSSTDVMDVFIIPEKSILMNLMVIPDVLGQASLKLKVDVVVGTTTTAAIAAADVATDKTISTFSTKTPTGSGMVVRVTPTAAPTAGRFIITAEYLEYTLSNGDLTNY